MGELFGSMYCWLEDFFGIELAEYLWGTVSTQQQGNMFIGIGLTMLCISLAVAVVYYYVVNHPRLNNWWGWLMFCGVNAFINFIVGWQWVLKDYYADKMVAINPVSGKEEALDIFPMDILAFGVTNMINAIIAYVIISYIVKWGSTNCSRAPF